MKKLTPILVPGALAATLLPNFEPAVAGSMAAVAIKNSLSLLHIESSTDIIEKFLKPIEGKQLEEEGHERIKETEQGELMRDAGRVDARRQNEHDRTSAVFAVLSS